MEDAELLRGVRDGNEACFRELVTRYHSGFVRVARYYVNSEASAEDVAQDTWLAVLRGAQGFEGRSSVKTWLFRILVNRARTTGVREHRIVVTDPTASVAASRFDQGGVWRDPPTPFTDLVDDAVAHERLLADVRAAIAGLPEPQQAVVTLRDVEGLSTAEVAELLELSEANVRVILHRARARVRNEVESSWRGVGS